MLRTSALPSMLERVDCLEQQLERRALSPTDDVFLWPSHSARWQLGIPLLVD